MNLSEFQHWLDGFRDGKDDVPSKEDWFRIRQKLRKEVENQKSAFDFSTLQTGSTITNI